MDRWDLIILLGAGYVAIVTLVRLMAKRRNELVEQVRGQLAKKRGGAAQQSKSSEK